MKNFLEEIVAYKKEILKKKKKEDPLELLKASLEERPLSGSFREAISGSGDNIALIAEVKKASPSAGVIREDFDPVALAGIYEQNGASAVSVITCEKYFQGRLEYLKDVSEKVNIPVLRKDFIVDEYQIYEARLWGADAVLLIARILDDDQLAEYMDCARGLGMDCLVEVHDTQDLDKVLNSSAEIIGINNRDLTTFNVDLTVAIKLASLIPDGKIIVAESGIKTKDDISLLRKSGINAILIGQTLLEAGDVAGKIKELGFGQD
ncbi:MAG: indole-3-glycerol phosphate synthase TrpC [bacterium]